MRGLLQATHSSFDPHPPAELTPEVSEDLQAQLDAVLADHAPVHGPSILPAPERSASMADTVT